MGDKAGNDSSLSILSRAGQGKGVVLERMLPPDLTTLLKMRDGVHLDTRIWLPAKAQASSVILLRTPYREEVLGWARLGVLRYVEAGFAVVFQLVRGIGQSQGTFSFNGPHDRDDGFDTIAWIADQAWCDGNIGMDGSSYVAMTQLTAAASRPPGLKCIAPTVPSADFFRELPYFGGGFLRQHTINWCNLISVDSLDDLTGGFVDAMPILSQPEWLGRVMKRPAETAADDVLKDDRLQHYRDVLAHPTFDDWWKIRTLSAADYEAIEIPVLVVSGNFDMGIGALTVWRGLEANAPTTVERTLLIGPWDHGQAYVGGGDTHGPYCFAGNATVDPFDVRLRFFERHLRGRKDIETLDSRVRVYVSGANKWLSFDRFPADDVQTQILYLHSGGRANGRMSDGSLSALPAADEPCDMFVTDPSLPYVAAMAAAKRDDFDLRERALQSDTLVYSSEPLPLPVTIIGEALVHLHIAASTPDADAAVWLAEANAEGQLTMLGRGFLRLRYSEGFDRERRLQPDMPVSVSIPLTYVSHEVAAKNLLVLLISGSMFPFVDPNPNDGAPIATSTCATVTRQRVFHDARYRSRLELPVYDQGEAAPTGTS